MTPIDKNKYFVVHADCIPVKGYKRSCLYDLTRKKYYFIPNSLCEIIKDYNGQLISKIFEDFNNNPILNEYFTFLIEKEVIHQSGEWELESFLPIDLKWKHPSRISTTVIDVGRATNFNIVKLRSALDSLGVKHLQIRKIEGDTDFINQLLSGLLNTRLKSIELILPFADNYLEETKRLKRINSKILLVYFYASHTFKTVKEANLPMIILTKDSVQMLHIEKSPNPKYFAVNIQLFVESQKHNTFYNRKIFIDKDGQLKNSFFGNTTFGHIDSIDTCAIIETPQFQEFWFVEKDKTAVCKDCEFRFMCTDPRIPLKENDEWVHTISCRYNPYLSKWVWEEGFEKPFSKSFSIHEN